MGKEELFNYRFLKYVVRGLGAIPMHRRRMLRKSLHQAEQVLARGQTLALFPEGARSHNGQLRPGFPGTALIAMRSAAPIIPVGITGTEKIKGLAWLLRRPQITVNIGRSFYLTPIGSNPTKKQLTEHVNFIMGRISALLPVEYQGCYAKLVD